MTDLRDAFLRAADHALALLSRDEVAAAWDRPSALAQWSVGGLAAHLADQVPIAVRLLTAEASELEPITVEAHYERAAWASASLDEEVNRGIRDRGEERACEGRDAVTRSVAEARVGLLAALAAAEHDRAVLIPWQGWALARDDFLTTRMLEVVVHGEDLAASVSIDAPPLPTDVLDPVLRLLGRLAVRRHGQAAVIAALSRSERAPRTVSAF